MNFDTPFVIAEAGTCHAAVWRPNRLPLALKYVEAAAKAGASGIKFQMFNPPIKNDMFCWIEGDEERSERWADSALSIDDWREVKIAAEAEGLVFLASAFQHSTVDWLNRLGVEAVKVASRAAKDFPYSVSRGPFLVSHGMYQTVEASTFGRVYHLQCEANYPSTMWWSGEMFGFSDHSGTPKRAMDALKRGCKLVEVHFYINEEDAGPDLPASLTTDELALVCKEIL